MNAVVKNNTQKVLTAYVSNGSGANPVHVKPGEKCILGKYSPYSRSLYRFNERRGFTFSIEEEPIVTEKIPEEITEANEVSTPEVSEPKRRGRRKKEEVPIEETEPSSTEVEESTSNEEDQKDAEESVTDDSKEEVEK